MGKERKLRRLPQGTTHSVRVEALEKGFRVTGEGPSFEAEVRRAGSGVWSVIGADGSSSEALVEREDGELRVTVGQEVFRFLAERDAARAASATASASRAEVKAPMPGKVVKLLAFEGQPVTAGQGVLLFEAMKMQNELRSPLDGVLAQVSVREGDAVEARTTLFVVAADAS